MIGSHHITRGGMSASLSISLFGMLNYRTRVWGITQRHHKLTKHRFNCQRYQMSFIVTSEMLVERNLKIFVFDVGF
jgi:hypothetical protein